MLVWGLVALGVLTLGAAILYARARVKAARVETLEDENEIAKEARDARNNLDDDKRDELRDRYRHK